MHNGKEAAKEGDTRMVVMMDHTLSLMSVDHDHPSTEFKGNLTCLDEQLKENI